MQYVMLIYATEGSEPQQGTPEWDQYMQGYMTYTSDAKKGGILHGGDALQPIATATTVKVRGGKTLTTDGPFAETKEQLGGFYILECDNLDEAIERAAKIPTATHGSIEIRPVMVWED